MFLVWNAVSGRLIRPAYHRAGCKFGSTELCGWDLVKPNFLVVRGDCHFTLFSQPSVLRPQPPVPTMAHKKGQGSSRNGRDSNAQRRGVKKFGGERVIAGNILIRQLGNKYHPGNGVGQGNDYTLFALVGGQVQFDREGRRVNVV